MNHRPLLLTATLLLGATSLASAQGTRLLRHPTVSKDQVAFTYAGDLWAVPRAGGQARRLTATPTVETEPYFSPDGSRIAFTATVGGNTDVYVMPTAGGDPTRLTFHPGLDRVRGWTPDGKRVRVRLGATEPAAPVVLPPVLRSRSTAGSRTRSPCPARTRVPTRLTGSASRTRKSPP